MRPLPPRLPPRTGAATISDAQARDVIAAAWRRVHGREPSEGELTYTQAIARLESQYGRAGQFGGFAAQGRYNWGSLHGAGTPPNCPAGTIEGVDLRPVCFAAFSSDEDAATAFVRNLTGLTGRLAARNAGIVEAMNVSPEDVARAMRTPPSLAYYEGYASTEAAKQAEYANAIRKSITAMKQRVPPAGSSSVSSGSTRRLLAGLLLLGAGAGLYMWWQQDPRVRRYAYRALKA